MKCLLLIDIQNDFVPGGALAVADGHAVVDVANRLISKFDLVVATQDWHPADHGSFASQHPGHAVGEFIDLDGLQQILWPDHCVQDSHGAEFIAELDHTKFDGVFRKGTQRLVDSYSGFFDNGQRHDTGLAGFLRAREVSDVYLVGLATDYCVKFSALDAVKCGFQTHLVIDGCRGVDLKPGDVEAAVQEMSTAGVVIGRSEHIT